MVLELGTYLDTHPDDMEAFDLFKQYAAMEKAAKETYEAKFGPLMKSKCCLRSILPLAPGSVALELSAE